MNDQYRVNYKCSNCNWSGTKGITYATLAPDLTNCPSCGCYTAHKNYNFAGDLLGGKNRPIFPLSPFGPGINYNDDQHLAGRLEVNPRSHTYTEEF